MFEESTHTIIETLALQYTNKLKRNVSTYFERALEPDRD